MRAVLAVCLLACVCIESQAQGLSGEFQAVRARISPRPEEEMWKQVPWKTSLLKAREAAAREGKPIFVWSMDGHPLCLG
jgi:hypothetical protein